MPQGSAFARPRLAGLLALVFLLSLPLVTTRLYASDEVEAFSWLHSLAFDHDVSFENEYQYFYDTRQVKNPSFHETFLERQTEAGRRINFTTMGAALLWAPFYAVAHVIAPLVGAPADGLSRPYVAAAAAGSVCCGWLAILLSASIARRMSNRAVAAAVTVLAGTPLVFYMYVTPLFTHACSAFAVSLFLWVWLRVRGQWSTGGFVALGLASALMTMVRLQDAFFIVGPALDLVRWAWRSKRWPVVPAIAGGVAFVAGLSPQLLAFKALNGHFGPSIYESRKMTWSSPHALQVVLDPQHGLLAWTPLALLAGAGLLLLVLVRRTPVDTAAAEPANDRAWLAFCALVMFALQAYIAGAVESWTVAGAFGQRRFVSVTPLLVIGMAALFASADRAPRAVRWAVGALAGLCIWWNVGLMAQFGMHTMDRERVQLGENAWRTFVELPVQAPSLLWRYVTNRASFYGQ